MSKSPETLKLEKALITRTKMFGTFGCPEVTIGWRGKKRVDFMETNTDGVIRCYEIKVTKKDFYSPHGHNFVGNYNYYVMPMALFNEVQEDVPFEIGVMSLLPEHGLTVIKYAKQKKLNEKEKQDMLLYLVRSMSREVKKTFDSQDKRILAYWKRRALQKKRKRTKVVYNKRKINT